MGRSQWPQREPIHPWPLALGPDNYALRVRCGVPAVVVSAGLVAIFGPQAQLVKAGVGSDEGVAEQVLYFFEIGSEGC